MYEARRVIALPAITFSLIAASRKPSGAMIRTRPARDVGLVDDAAHAGEVVDVAVRVDDRVDRPLAEVLRAPASSAAARRLGRGQRIDHDPAAVAAR